MRILSASSEVLPYSKTGGLADMAGALAKFMARAGHKVGVVTPLHGGMRKQWPAMRLLDWKLELPLGRERVAGKVWTLEAAPNLTIYFIEQERFFDRPGIYQERGKDYSDNAERFAFFSKSVAHLARYLPWAPQIVHLHDWPTALAALFILDQKLYGNWLRPPRVVMTIHNVAYQGNFDASTYALTNLPGAYFQPEGVEFYRRMSYLKAGIAYADAITAVSPRYAREITTESLGHGMDGILRRRQNVLCGILNGVDYDEWKTEGNPDLRQPYNVQDMAGKQINKVLLQRELGLPEAPDIPLFGSITRLADQKGVDLILASLQEMLACDMQFVLLGKGHPEFELGLQALARRHPSKCVVRIGFDTGLSHRIEAGCDFYLMPSRFEPCGLNQMYSLRYGAVPVVRATGGLDDTVIDITENPEGADGIKFSEYSTRAFSRAIRKALALYGDKALLEHYRRNGMTRDFSWQKTAATYAALYESSLSRS
jgi:starch synthase